MSLASAGVTVGDRAAICTSSGGTHSFTVTATDNNGQVVRRTVSYTVAFAAAGATAKPATLEFKIAP